MDAVKSAGRSRTGDGGEAHESTKGELKQAANGRRLCTRRLHQGSVSRRWPEAGESRMRHSGVRLPPGRQERRARALGAGARRAARAPGIARADVARRGTRKKIRGLAGEGAASRRAARTPAAQGIARAGDAGLGACREVRGPWSALGIASASWWGRKTAPSLGGGGAERKAGGRGLEKTGRRL